jgi:opacity protein-like surface antigen
MVGQEGQNMKSIAFLCAAASIILMSPAFALDVPTTAKKLTAAEWKVVYDNKTHEYNNLVMTEGNTGTFRYVYKTKKVFITPNLEGKTEKWETTFKVNKDQLCIKNSPKKYQCFVAYLDGTTLYEVDPKTNKVWSQNTLKE